MKTKIEINLKPFRTPNFVLTEVPKEPAQAPSAVAPLHDEYRVEEPKYKLSELSVVTLNDLCEQFKQDIFKKAGKDLPIQIID